MPTFCIPSTRRHYRAAFPAHDPGRSLSGWPRELTGVPVIAVGSVGLDTEHSRENMTDPVRPAPVDRLVAQFAAGEFDIAAVGADPGWVNRLRDGELDQFAGYDPATALAGLN